MLLCAHDSLLLVVDIQERLAAAMAAADREQVARTTGLLIDSAALLRVPVLVSEQYPTGLGPTVAAVREHLSPETPVQAKTAFSCWCDTGLQESIASSGRSQIVIAGMEAHVCVLQTAHDLVAEGYEVQVAADAVCSRDSGNRDLALERLRHAGVVITCAESVVFEWLRDASHSCFRSVSSLLK